MKSDKGKKPKIIFIVGPTAAGKTGFSIRLARELKGEIISADSMQAYRYMDIISQKPTAEERKIIPHHLIDILNPSEEYSAAKFAKMAVTVIHNITERGRMPIVVGGSGLYMKALLDGLFHSPERDLGFRKGLADEAKDKGNTYMHDELKKVDPQAASGIHPNDLRRIIRALEVYHLTGIPISELKKRAKGIRDDFEVHIYGIIRPRPVIYKMIEERVDRMFNAGLLREVEKMRNKRPSVTAGVSLGYREVLGYLEGRYSLEDAKNLLRKNTKHFAKKQLTWFKADNRITWIDIEKTSQKKALQLVKKSLRG